MFLLRLLFKNAFRHKLRTILTMVGLVVAISAFGFLNTIVEAWYGGVDGTSSTRLITRSAISMGSPLPLSYMQRIRSVEGVSGVTWANWFGGVYIDRKNFFPRFAVDPHTYFQLYPEYIVSDKERADFTHDRQGAIIGSKLAERFGWKVGDTIPLKGDIYPGTWNFTVRGIYRTRDAKTDGTMMFMQWQLLNESLRQRAGSLLADKVGVYIVNVTDSSETSTVSQRIDALFQDSPAETRTETEKAFQLGFVSMSETILLAIRGVSFVVLIIIMAVMANTMTMTARERLAEYATLKALGFSPSFVVKLLFGESLAIVFLGGSIGIAVTFPMASTFAQGMGALFKNFDVSYTTIWQQALASLVVGLVSAAWPAWKMSRIDIVQGLRHFA